MTRYRAGFNHLIISTIIFATTFYFVIMYWYPGPYFSAAGGWQGLKIAAGVDLVLGPILMLVVFNKAKGKAKLLFDIVVIVTLQLSALIWGIHTIYQERPVATVFWESSFYSVPAKAVDEDDLSIFKNTDEIPFVYAKKPTTEQALNKILERMAESKIPPHHQMELYVKLLDSFSEILPYAININDAMTKNSDANLLINNYFEDTSNNIDEYVFFPMFSKYRNVILMFDKEGNFNDYFVLPPSNN